MKELKSTVVSHFKNGLDMILQLNNISVCIAQKQILRGVSLDVQNGEILALLGANGAGKSTLLKTMAKHHRPNAGTIRFKGTALNAWPERTLSQHRAVLSQQVAMHFSMKVLEVVLLGRYPFVVGQKPSINDVAIAYEVLDIMGLADRAEEDILTLSGGQQQRVHIARVLAQIWDSSHEAPSLLCLDEPTASLDITYQQLLLQIVRSRCITHGLSVVVILHDINMAAQYADRIALLKQGRLLTVGTVEDVLTPDWIQESFGVSAYIQRHPVLDCLQVLMY